MNTKRNDPLQSCRYSTRVGLGMKGLSKPPKSQTSCYALPCRRVVSTIGVLSPSSKFDEAYLGLANSCD